MKILFAALLLMVFSLPIVSLAQSAESAEPEKTNKTFISVPVSVSDREGHYISGLKKEDFAIYQDGIKQKISFFATYDEPINVVLLLDTSASTQGSLGKIKKAAEDFIDLLNPADRCLLATFDERVNVLNSFTSDRELLKTSLSKAQAAVREGSVVYGAVEQISQNSFDNAAGRRVIVLLSDGKDFGSSITKDRLLNLLEESDVLIYTVFYKTGAGFNKPVIDSDGTLKEGKEVKKTSKKPKKKKKGYSVFLPGRAGLPSTEEIKFIEKNADIEAVNFLREMSDTTAGRFYLSDTPNLSGIFKEIAGELRQQYRLGFHAKEVAGEAPVYNIVVKVDRPDVVVRAREKYRAKQL